MENFGTSKNLSNLRDTTAGGLWERGGNSGLTQASKGSNSGLVVSVVSHGHGASVRALLHDLARLCADSITRVVLTLNQPGEPLPYAEGEQWPFVLQLRRNARPLGFGANHNQSLAEIEEAFVCILNPDVRLVPECDDVLAALVATARQPGTGCAYPVQVGDKGIVQDSERALPTPAALWRRRALARTEARVDWVNAACMVLPRSVWESVGGFDESYHMYCEDVDLCLRIQLAGYRLEKADCMVVHAGNRASHRKLNHLRWHISSMLRLWASPAYRQYKKISPSLG